MNLSLTCLYKTPTTKAQYFNNSQEEDYRYKAKLFSFSSVTPYRDKNEFHCAVSKKCVIFNTKTQERLTAHTFF